MHEMVIFRDFCHEESSFIIRFLFFFIFFFFFHVTLPIAGKFIEVFLIACDYLSGLIVSIIIHKLSKAALIRHDIEKMKSSRK